MVVDRTVRTSRCVFQFLLCGSPIQIRKLTPAPTMEGEFFLAFRETRCSPIIPLFCGITRYGVSVMIDAFQNRRYSPTNLLELIAHKAGY